MAAASAGGGSEKSLVMELRPRRLFIKKALTAITSNGLELRDKNVYPARISMFQSGTEKRHNNAMAAFAPGCTYARQVLLVDDTLLGSGKKGFLFAVDGLYASKGYFDGVSMPILYEELASVEMAKGSRDLILHYRDGHDVKGYTGVYTCYLCAALQAILQALEKKEAAKELTTDDLYAQGMEHFKAGDYEKAYKMLWNAERSGEVEKHPKEMLALGWLYENGQGTNVDAFMAFCRYADAAASGDQEGMAKVVRMAAINDDERLYRTALKYAKQLNTEEARKQIPLLEQKIAAAQGGTVKANVLPKPEPAQKAEPKIPAEPKPEPAQKAEPKIPAEPKPEPAQKAEPKIPAEPKPEPVQKAEPKPEPAQKAEPKIPAEPKPEAGSELAALLAQEPIQSGKYAKGLELFLAEDYDAAFSLLQGELAGNDDATDNCLKAMTAIGWLYENGRGTEVNLAEALNWYKKAAERGYVGGQYQLGDMYCNGRGVNQDYSQAIKWYEKAAEQGYIEAQYSCGLLYDLDHNNLMYDGQKALYWYKKAAERGHADAQFCCGMMYYYGADDVPKDMAKAFYWYKKAAEQGDNAALVKLGNMFINGEGTKEDVNKGLHLIKKAAEQGYDKAQMLVAQFCLEQGSNPALALRWYEKAARQGNFEAQFNCGVMYCNGEGTEADPAKGLYWFEKAAEQGFTKAQYVCGQIYYNGEGIKADQVKGLYWYEEAAKQGFIEAQYCCGIIYSNSNDERKQDYAKALYWFLKAAEQGDARCQFHCGSRYERGKGVKEDYTKALFWYETAAEQGYADAQYSCAKLYDEGKGTAMDKKKALYWYEQAAEQKNIDAEKRLSQMYKNGEGTPINMKKAKMWEEQAFQDMCDEAMSFFSFNKLKESRKW